MESSLISKKIVKPSIPTPLPLKYYKLSFVDQILHMSIPFAFFYPKNRDDKSYEPAHASQILEKSLSKLLSFYYPYAGRLMKDGSTIDCNDMGVELLHVRVHCSMSEILKNPYTNAEHVVFPVSQPFKHHEENLAVAQVSYFDCGGIAIGGCLSHKIGDACTSSNFFYDWGILSRDASSTPSPYFVGESIYPQSTDPFVIPLIKPEEPEGYIGKRFIFQAAEIRALKKLYSVDSRVQNPVTRTEALSTLIYKCALAAAAKTTNFGSCKQSLLSFATNMRKRLNPPLSENACGNIGWYFTVGASNNNEINCPKLVSEIKKQKEKLNNDDHVSSVIDEVLERNKKVHTKIDVYVCSSLLDYPLYKTDFGWGNPARVSFATGHRSKFFILMDNQSGGGVEAIIMLNKQEMAIFEKDPELLEVAVPAVL